jgi:hypothetical protein
VSVLTKDGRQFVVDGTGHLMEVVLATSKDIAKLPYKLAGARPSPPLAAPLIA